MRFLTTCCIALILACSPLTLPTACPAAEPTPLESAHPMIGTATLGTRIRRDRALRHGAAQPRHGTGRLGTLLGVSLRRQGDPRLQP